MKRILLIGLALLLFCQPGRVYASGIPVVVSIYPLKDIVRNVGGDKVQVDFMVPPGATPHTFEPTPSDMLKIQRARLFFMVGAGLEFWAEKAIRAAARKDLRVVVLSSGMPLLNERHDHPGERRGERIADPHVWLDPLLVRDMVDRIASALIEVDPSHKDYYKGRAERYREELTKLSAEIAERVSTFRQKEYVTFHPAWNYFSRRYGLKVVGVIEESPGKEAGPRQIAKLLKEIKRTGARVVFAEPQFNPKSAEVIAKESGARVLFLDPLGSPGIPGREAYIPLMRYNLSVLEGAMK